MVAKRELKFIKSLQQKKYRSRYGLFLAEGLKVVDAFLQAGWKPAYLYTTDPPGTYPGATPISVRELESVSTLVQPNKVLAVFPIPEAAEPGYGDWVLALDQVRDPGNLGTIIRLCDWFGVREILCSPDTVDCYNPKVVMASMGSLAGVRVHYRPLGEALAQSGLPVFGADMHGAPVAGFDFPEKGVLLMGSESHGISGELRDRLTDRLGIMPYGDPGAESLNVGTATGILLYELRRGLRPIQR